MVQTIAFQDGHWESGDGLKLHYRDYPGPKDRPAILCMPGLTRNVRDFEPVAERLAGRWRLLCVEFRGRGESDPSPESASYNPLVYSADVLKLVDELKLKKLVCLGTSLGGLVTMLIAMQRPGLVRAAILNDVGPVLEKAGLDRLKTYVGRYQSWPTWVHAARALQELQGLVYPDYDLTDWIALAKRLHRITPQGRVVPDYDMRIAEPMKEPAPDVDMWPAWMALGDAPTLLLRGALSDILSAEAAKEMVKRRPVTKLTTIARVGHAPALDEPQSQRAIEAFLKTLHP